MQQDGAAVAAAPAPEAEARQFFSLRLAAPKEALEVPVEAQVPPFSFPPTRREGSFLVEAHREAWEGRTGEAHELGAGRVGDREDEWATGSL